MSYIFYLYAPEILLALGSLVALMVGVFTKENYRSTQNTTKAFVMATGVLLLAIFWSEPHIVGREIFQSHQLKHLLKLLLLFGTLFLLFTIHHAASKETVHKPELPVLIGLSVVGMMIMIGAEDFLTLFMGIELQSLALYILVGFRRDHAPSSEAALKYFVLGVVSSGIFLLGVSYLYGVSGSIAFEAIGDTLRVMTPLPPVALFGSVLVILSLFFKLSLVPFHLWVPDVYEGSPTVVTTFLSTLPKLAVLGVFFNLLTSIFLIHLPLTQTLIAVAAVLSMVLGALGGLLQTNVKRLMGYSAIGNMGYAMIGFLLPTPAGAYTAFVYASIYIITTFAFFACLCYLQDRERHIVVVEDLSGLWSRAPGVSIVMLLLLFSLAGIPPLAGFMGKLYVFRSGLEAGFTLVAVVGVLTSVIAAGYYLRLVKAIMIDVPKVNYRLYNIDKRAALLMASICTGILILLFVRPALFLSSLEHAFHVLKMSVGGA